MGDSLSNASWMRFQNLGSYPQIGRRVPEAERDDVRELIYRSYRIIYLTRPEHLYIIAVVHGSRDLTRGVRPWEVA